MARLSDIKKDEIIIGWKSGISQNDLAKIHGVSKGAVNKICKGVEQTIRPLVNAQVEINQQLAHLNDREMTAFDREVSEKTKRIIFFQESALKNQHIADTLLDSKLNGKSEDGLTLFDVESHSRITARNKETVCGKTPDTAIQINNNRIVDDGSNEW